MTEPKHSHYKKNVAGLSMIDVYRVLDLFGVTDPCIQHAAKKLLATGLRGHKDAARDIQDAIDTLERWKEMRVEDRQRQSDRHPMTPNVIEPASQIDDDSPRQQKIQQGGEMASEIYGELDRLQAAADFNDDLPV